MLGTILLASQLEASNQGTITRIMFSSSNSTWGHNHSNLVQLEITGGYSVDGCNADFAAIRKEEEHLVSAALAAYVAGRTVSIQLNKADTYYDGSRCIISDLAIQ